VTVTSADATTAAQTNQLRFNLGISGRPRAARQLEILALRCLEMADPVSAGELPFIDTVDAIYDAALRSAWCGKSATISSSERWRRPSPTRGGRHDHAASVPAERDRGM
jgi:hypothetical protein